MQYLLFILSVFSHYAASAAYPSPVNCHPSTFFRQPSSQLNRPAFYKAMEGTDKTLVNFQITALNTAPDDLRQAFLGAMMMKKAGMGGTPAVKLRLFKEGHKMLETAIREEPDNAEFRFLRLIIQEHAPGALGYKNDLEKDSDFIKKSYNSLPDEVQLIIADYSKNSRVLKLGVS